MDEDFSKTLDELKLCPASTIYFHIVNLILCHIILVFIIINLCLM